MLFLVDHNNPKFVVNVKLSEYLDAYYKSSSCSLERNSSVFSVSIVTLGKLQSTTIFLCLLPVQTIASIPDPVALHCTCTEVHQWCMRNRPPALM